jgi:ABC-type antimicrobial peptide transport system permease subunit
MEWKDEIMASNSSTTNGGIGFVGLLTIVFITLKLIPDEKGHIIDWSWWWVLSPIWISAGIVVVIILIAIAAALFAADKHSKIGRR